MKELNHTKSVDVSIEEGFDTLTSVNLGDSFSFAQVAEDGDMHNIVVGPAQAEAMIRQLSVFLG